MSPKARFLKYVLRSTPYVSGCWEWTGATAQSGAGPVGRFKYEGRSQWAPRVAYHLYKGRIPRGKVVCHRCDNPLCVRPAHLFLGTHKQNAQDKVRKGRAGRGGTGPKLNADQRQLVHSMLAQGYKIYLIAAWLEVSRQAISYYAKKLKCGS